MKHSIYVIYPSCHSGIGATLRRYCETPTRSCRRVVAAHSSSKKIQPSGFAERVPANWKHWPNVVLMLCRRRRRWANIWTTLGQCLVFDGGGAISSRIDGEYDLLKYITARQSWINAGPSSPTPTKLWDCFHFPTQQNVKVEVIYQPYFYHVIFIQSCRFLTFLLIN